MTLYVDTSVLLRVVLGERGRLREWSSSRRWVASELIRLECLRTIDRARLELRLSDRALASRRAAVLEYLRAFDLVQIDRTVLDRAAEPFPTSLGSLDAVHLASALAARPRFPELAFATHDQQLAVAAHAMGFAVVGVKVPT